MEIVKLLGAGILATGLAAGIAVGQNQVNLGSPGTIDPSSVIYGTMPDPAGGGFTDTLSNLDRLDKKGAYVASLLLYNSDCAEETVALTAKLRDRNGEPLEVTIEPSPSEPVKPGDYKMVRLAIKKQEINKPEDLDFGILKTVQAALLSSPMRYGAWTGYLPARGRLILAPSYVKSNVTDECKAAPRRTSRDLSLLLPLPSKVDTGVLIASLFLAVTVTFFAGLIISVSHDSSLRAGLGDMSFNFNSSWGANVAVGAAILTTLTSGAVLAPDQYSSSSKTYLVLAGLFAALVPLGATLYGLIRPSVTSNSQPRGYAIAYLLSSAVVLWGAFGQLLLLGMLLKELTLARVIASEPADVLIWVTRGLTVILIVYAVITARATVRKGTEESSVAREAAEAAKAAAKAASTAKAKAAPTTKATAEAKAAAEEEAKAAVKRAAEAKEAAEVAEANTVRVRVSMI